MVIYERTVFSAIEFLDHLDPAHYATVCRQALDEFRDVRRDRLEAIGCLPRWGR